MIAGTYHVVYLHRRDDGLGGQPGVGHLALRLHVTASATAAAAASTCSLSGHGPGIWAQDADGPWSTGSNWFSGFVPTSGPESPVTFGNVITAARTVTLDTTTTHGTPDLQLFVRQLHHCPQRREHADPGHHRRQRDHRRLLRQPDDWRAAFPGQSHGGQRDRQPGAQRGRLGHRRA